MKGFFTQGVAVLTDKQIPVYELFPLLSEHRNLCTLDGSPHWELSGPAVVVPYREEVNGTVVIDTVDHRWPDLMGDPKSDPMLFGAWSMGHFGPFTFPGALKRAVEQAWSWPEAKSVVPRHRAFFRLRTTYLRGAEEPSAFLKPPGNPLQELDFILGLTQRIMQLPAALCYFNSNGEVVAPREALDHSIEFHRAKVVPPFDLIFNVRLFNLPPDWLLMDTVGCAQLDMPDHEAVFPKGSFESTDVAGFLRHVAFYVLQSRKIEDRDTADGPGNVRWQAVRFARPMTDPPREVLCWVPHGVLQIPEQVTNRRRTAS